MKNLDCNCLLVNEQAPIDLDNRLEGIALTFEQGLERTKPYTIGLVVGGFAAPIVGFNAGWITTTTASAQAAETPRVDALTGICSSAAGRMQPPAAQAWPPSRATTIVRNATSASRSL